MKTLAVAACAMLLVGAGVYALKSHKSAGSREAAVVEKPQSREAINAYFAQKVEERASALRTEHPDKDIGGYTGGVSGFLVIETFPGLVPADFNAVEARSTSGESGGTYSEREGELSFFGHAASDSGNISPLGMATLLDNVSRRLSLPIRTTADIDTLLARISQ